MLEGLAAWVLNTYVGEYVENLNTHQLSIALLQGAVELENLPLKKDALKSLDLPLEVKSGYIGKIALQIPVRRLRSEPWGISIEKLYLVAGPLKKTHQYDEAKEKKSEQDKKEALLRGLEEKWQIQKQEKANSYGSSWFSYGTSMATNILENLQLTVKNVHIRYEDSELTPACPFACGITIKSLSAQMTDGSWVPKFVSRDGAEVMHKLLDLQEFSAYLDINATMLGDLSMTDLFDALEREMYVSSSTNQFEPHNYILQPVSAQAKMKRNMSPLPLRSTNFPRIHLDFNLETMGFSLGENQYKCLMLWLKEFERYGKRRKYRKWKPECSVMENAKEWWRYAIKAHLHPIQDRKRRSSKAFLIQRVSNVIFYHKAYCCHLAADSSLTSAMKSHMQKMESEWSFEEVKIIREKAYQKMKLENKLPVVLAHLNKHDTLVPLINVLEKNLAAFVHWLDLLVTSKSQISIEQKAEAKPEEKKSIFQGWFPGWGGWYRSSSQETSVDIGDGDVKGGDNVGEPPPSVDEENLEQEIMDVIQDSTESSSFLERDAVFAVLNFSLQKAYFKLIFQNDSSTDLKSLKNSLELECTAVSMLFQSRPKISGMRFGISVGGLYLRDKLTENVNFPCLMGPQSRDRIHPGSKQFFGAFTNAPSSEKTFAQTTSSEDKVFELLYEKNPPNSKSTYRLKISTQPLDIVYNPAAVTKVKEFFKRGSATRSAEHMLTAAAKKRYERLKRQTQAELKQTFGQLLDGEEMDLVNKWDVQLDVSAPQFKLPESFVDPNTTLFVFDFGHLKFHNVKNEQSEDNQQTEEIEDDYITPCSTPPNESSDGEQVASSEKTDILFPTESSETDLYEKLYDKYMLELSDLQVMVGKATDNWKHAHYKGSSHLHLVDRFSINVQLERRLLHTPDPQWPSLTLTGTLPSLTVHVNEQKVHAVYSCMDGISNPKASSVNVQSSSSLMSLGESPSTTQFDEFTDTIGDDARKIEESIEKQVREVLEDSRLLVAQFAVNFMSLEVSSRGRPVAELQVAGVKANLRKRPYDTSVNFSVHSLLVVDALQTYGPDFELLVASHKNVCFDSKSGTMLDSDPSSPQSPHSPPSPRSPGGSLANSFNTGVQVTASPSGMMDSIVQKLSIATQSSSAYLKSVISSASTTLLDSKNSRLTGCKSDAELNLPQDSEALITLDFEIISPSSPSRSIDNEPLHVINLQFNNLDFIANQETIVELLSFMKQIKPKPRITSSLSVSRSSPTVIETQTEDGKVDKPTYEVTADFSRLNIMLLRIEDSNGIKSARKVATATLSSARVQATLTNHVDMDGSLGGFQIMDITPEGKKHQKVFSVGHDPLEDPVKPLYASMYKTATESMLIDDVTNDTRAFTFHFTKQSHLDASYSNQYGESHDGYKSPDISDSNTTDLKIHMASLCYTHSPKFLNEISKCVSEFKEYMESFASSLKKTAAEVAMGFVGKNKADVTDLYGSFNSLNFSLDKDLNRVESINDLNSMSLDNSDMDEKDAVKEGVGNIMINAVLETPVIVIPRTCDSSEALVAQLGQIFIINNDESIEIAEPKSSEDLIGITVKNMNLYSVDLEKTMQESSNTSVYHSLLHSSVSNRNIHGTPIIYDTNIEITVNKTHPNVSFINTEYTHKNVSDDSSRKFDIFPSTSPQTLMNISVFIATPFRMVLSKSVYEQILQTVDNITYDEPEGEVQPSQSEEDVSVRSSVSKEHLSDHNLTKSVSFSQTESQQEVPISRHVTTDLIFKVPVFNIELRGDVGDGEHGLVDLNLFEFSLFYEKNNPFRTDFKISLKSLMMEDLLEAPDSNHRNLMVSKNTQEEDDSQFQPKHFLSVSCPNNAIVVPTPRMPCSLPASFKEDALLENPTHSQMNNRSSLSSKRSEGYPCTPPPSRTSRIPSVEKIKEENLVSINVTLIDKKSKAYTEVYNKTNRYIDIDFNCLEATINLQTWVVLLDFLGMGAKIHDLNELKKKKAKESEERKGDKQEKEIVNSEINLKINSLTVVLNKPAYELAKANISKFNSHLVLRDENFSISGQLGSMSLLDQSPHGELFRERFMTVGDQALEFDFFKFGIPDPCLSRDYDMKLKIRMSSVRYVHTNHFQIETVAFLQHFMQLQDVLGRMRAESAGQQISNTLIHQPRVIMDIEAAAPIVLIPHSSKTTDVLVADFGNLTVNNCFMIDGDEGTNLFQKNLELQAEKASLSKNTSVESLISSPSIETAQSTMSTVHSMTESVYSEFLPPKSNVDPMTDSIYGSLNSDLRDAQERDFFDPTDPNKNLFGSSVDPIKTDIDVAGFSLLDSFMGCPSPDTGSTSESYQTATDRKGERSPSVHSFSSTASPNSPTKHRCLLDVMSIVLSDMDLYSAERVNKKDYKGKELKRDLEFPSCVVQRMGVSLCKDKFMLKLQAERNLEGDISHSAPDWCVTGMLTSIHCSIDIHQYKLIRGILDHNLGEKLDDFPRPIISDLFDPQKQEADSGKVWKGISIAIDLNNITVELLMAHDQGPEFPEVSLTKLDLNKSKLTFESYSNQCKVVDLVSHEITACDTRYRDAPMNARPNVFTDILQKCKTQTSPNSLQLELHFRSSKDGTRFTILLNNMKMMCIFDWLLTVQEFLMTNAENPFVEGASLLDTSDLAEAKSDLNTSDSGRRTVSPVTVSSGIMTRRGPVIQQADNPFELKLNVSDTEFVVVEDCKSWDTNAVILKSTAVVTYKPKSNDRLMSCSLQSLEVFSCCLIAEEETALSIIDPMTISIELNANPLPEPRTSPSGGLLDVTDVEEKQLLLEVSFNTMNIRLSYTDMKMFLAILNSLPKQAMEATKKKEAISSTKFPVNDVMRLKECGFTQDDCEKALEVNNGNIEEAAIWLPAHCKPDPEFKEKNDLKVTGIDLKATSICLCFIDDCKGVDVPLAELTLNGLNFSQKLLKFIEGRATFQMVGEYYNRALSGWEPFLEPWRCHAEWRQYSGSPSKLAVQVSASEVLNMNITSTLIEQYTKTRSTWTEDYYKNDDTEMENSHPVTHSASTSSVNVKRRMPFIPFVIRNQTGCKLWFTTVTKTPSRVYAGSSSKDKKSDGNIKASEWKQVHPDEEVPFTFQHREKLRHKISHEVLLNQITVKVDGWQKMSEVSVDKVGIYFREVDADPMMSSFIISYPARIVFDVKPEGSARKVVIIRSSLIFNNQLNSPLDFKVEDSMLSGQYPLFTVEPSSKTPVPLKFAQCKFCVKPRDWSVNFCSQRIEWQQAAGGRERVDAILKCHPESNQQDSYRLCVCIKKLGFPDDHRFPGHTITFSPSVVVRNLLPIEMNYYFSGTDIFGTIKPFMESFIHAADSTDSLELGVRSEYLTECRELAIPPNTDHYKVKLRLYDTRKRLLELQVRISSRHGGPLKLDISSPFWLVNKSGLPLLFRQDGAKNEAAGQFEEHELARSVTPLLFSFAEKELAFLCQMRIGKNVHGPNAISQWCSSFSLESGVGVRQLHVVDKQTNRPDWLVELEVRGKLLLVIPTNKLIQVYNIGIEVRNGRGKYRDSNMVTFAPRYEINNQSKHRIAIAQRHFTKGQATLSIDRHLTALPFCKLPFHWPRLDLDQLLCVKLLDFKDCEWSGGFRIDRVNSFHINMRDSEGRSHLLKVEITVQGPTFCIEFGNAEDVPPPFRIDNLSEMPILYYQTKVTEDRLKTQIKPQTALPYAWDEPCLDPYITLSVPGGNSATYNMNKLEEGEQLCYENFIFLAASATFQGGPTSDCIENRELVLDCTHGNNIVLMRKEMGKRSQLWRMTSSGMLVHEGSRPPQDPCKNKSSNSTSQSLVLDVMDNVSSPGCPLILRKPDENRSHTQKWRFTEDGRLCCGLGNSCVQAVGGLDGLQNSALAALGPGPPPFQPKPVSPYMLISRQKLRPGSGCLTVRIHMDGPIRVLQITDIQQRKLIKRSVDDWEVYEQKGPPAMTLPPGEDILPAQRNLELSLHLKGGLGISLVNKVPEELCYISLSGITVEYNSTPSMQSVDASISNIQIDNQLLESSKSAVLFVTPTSKKDRPDNTPTLHIIAHKVPTRKWNAEIFKHLVVSMKKMTLQLQERWLWKMLKFMGFQQSNNDLYIDTTEYDSNKSTTAATSTQVKRFYFGLMKLNISRVTLSMYTASKLSPDLYQIKSSLSIPLIRFEDAKVDLDPFIRYHPFETSTFLLNEVKIHYTEELKSQAAKILGSVDFLGNPLGLFNDVTEGISGLIKDGNVGGLLRNVTHGVSNSAAKFTGALSDSVGAITVLDDSHNRTREQIKTMETGGGGEHIKAGLKGLGYGLVGGLTSVIKQTYKGARDEGVEGFFTGFGKGIVGTVTKPVAGVLDFASEAASAVKDTSRGRSHLQPKRIREPRCSRGPGGLLPVFSRHHADSQKLLYIINENNFNEFFMAIEQMRYGHEDSLRVIITSEQAYFLGRGGGTDHSVVLSVLHRDLLKCEVLENNSRYYIALQLRDSTGPSDALKKPQVRCDKESIAQRISQQISYARGLYEERTMTLTSHTDQDSEMDV